MRSYSKLFLVIMLIALSSPTGSPARAVNSISEEPARYLENALDEMQRLSVKRNEVDRPSIRAKVNARAGDAQSPEDTHEALRLAIELIDDGDSYLYVPAKGGDAADGALLAASAAAGEDWSQWAGPLRSFAVESNLDGRWPEAGPRIVWRRTLGNGHAGIVTAGARLFTAYGGGRQETVLALDRHSGRTLWERSYDVGYAAHREDWDGPHATPLVIGERLVTVGIDATVRAWRVEDGELVWQRDLRADHDVKLPQSGYASSPLAWDGLILLPGLGGAAPGALALRLADGQTVWARHDFPSSHASPVLVRFADRDHAVFHGLNELYGLDPASGDRIWSHPLRDDAADNVSFTPIWDASRRQLLISHGYDDSGMRAIRLNKDKDGIRTEEMWANRRLRVDHGNAVLLGGAVYASHRSDPGILIAIDTTDGELLWRHRLPKVTGLRAGDKLLLLDEDGWLHLARPERKAPGILASTRILENNAWTVPSLVGRRLYARDRHHIVALELP